MDTLIKCRKLMTARLAAMATLVVLLLAACLPPRHLPPASTGLPPATPVNGPAYATATKANGFALAGRVVFPERTVQAEIGDVANAATVSLIDSSTNVTKGATVTGADGTFVVVFPGGFIPDANTVYYLEAFKGLGGNRPGSPVARVRSIVKFDGSGWNSLTGTTVVVSRASTALAVGAALRHQNPDPFDFGALLGKLTTASTPVYTETGGLTAADYASLLTLISNSLVADRDPVAGMALSLPGTWRDLAAGGGAVFSITSFSPDSGTYNTTVTANGKGFTTTPGDHTVRFNGIAATPTGATSTTLTLKVPDTATTGQTQLQIGPFTSLGPNFTVPVVVSGLSVSTGTYGTSVVVSGSGFDKFTAANNVVRFNGAAATVSAASTGSLTVAVPTGATSGPVTVTVNGATGTSAATFSVPVTVSGFTPTYGPEGATVTLNGSGFSSTADQNVVRFNGVQATVLSSSPTSLTAVVPASATTGTVAVTVGGVTGTSAANFNVATVDTATPVTLTSFSPAYGLAGTSVTLTGTGFSYLPAESEVMFNGVAASVSQALANSLRVTIPEGATTGTISIRRTADNQTVTSTGSFSVTAYDPGVTPVILDMDPSFGTAGATITITGRGFSSVVADNTVKFNNVTATVSAASSVSLTVEVPASTTTEFVTVQVGTRTGTSPRNFVIGTSDPGYISTIAGNGSSSGGDGGQATSAGLTPNALAFDASGNLYVAAGQMIRKINTSGVISTIAGGGGNSLVPDGIAATSAFFGNLYAVAAHPLTQEIYFVHNCRIRKITSAGLLASVAGTSSCGYSGDGGAPLSALLRSPNALVFDASGALYVGGFDSGTAKAHIRKISADGGTISTFASNLGDTYGPYESNSIAIDSAGNVYVAILLARKILKISPDGQTVTTFAGTGSGPAQLSDLGDGGPATSGKVDRPAGIAVDADDNVYFVDNITHRVEKITTDGKVHIIAGSGGIFSSSGGFSGDGGSPLAARFNRPSDVKIDSSGNLYIADTVNNRIRRVMY